MKKAFFIILSIILFIVIGFIGCNNKEINEQELIVDYVIEHQTILNEIINEIKSLSEIDDKSIIKKMPKNINIYSIYKSEQSHYIEFSVDEGTTTRSHYYGFYYTSKDVPLAAGIEDKRLKKDGNGYRIQEEGKEDWYYTEKIVDNFYFYEDHY